MKIEISKPMPALTVQGWMCGVKVDGKPFGGMLGATKKEAKARAIFVATALEVVEEEEGQDCKGAIRMMGLSI